MSRHAAAMVAVRTGDDDPVVAALKADDGPAFTTLVERHTRELKAHCRRMLGSAFEAEDVVQETFLRAWRKRATFEGRSTFRTWLYRIATNACLDELRRRSGRTGARPTVDGDPSAPAGLDHAGRRRLHRRRSHAGSVAGLGDPGGWGGDGWAPETTAPPETEPEAAVVARTTFEVDVLGTLHHLPPQQRAVVVLRDGFGWSAADTATLLDTTVAAANSALQRARTTLRAQDRRDDPGCPKVALR